MRLIKLLGLGAATLAVVAFLNATTAMASEPTSLCRINEIPCAAKNRPAEVHLAAGTVTFTIGMVTVSCLGSLIQTTVEGSGLSTPPNPLGLKVTQWTWSNCGTNLGESCELKTAKLPLLDVLRTIPNLGTVKMLSLEISINCAFLHCVVGANEISKFPLEGALHQAATGKGMFSATGVFLPTISGLLCMEEGVELTALFEPLEHVYIST